MALVVFGTVCQGLTRGFWGDLSVSLSGVVSSGGASEAPSLISPKLSRFLVQFSTWATWLLDYVLLLVGKNYLGAACPRRLQRVGEASRTSRTVD
jgi:hypothetical protein